MKHHINFINKIVQIENEFDVNSLVCNGVHMWPLIRLELVGVIMNNQINSCPHITSLDGLQKKHNSNIVLFDDFLESLYHQDRADILLFSDEFQNSSIKIEGKYFNRFIDSFYEIFKDEYKIKVINIKDKSRLFFNDQIKIDISFVKEVIRIDSLLSFANNIYSVDNLDKFIQFLSKKEISIDADYLLYLCTRVMVSVDHLESLLKKIPAKSIALLCYYIDFNMALVLAAKKLNIATIELQHGIQNDYHYMYTHWSKIPKDGYELLPKYFWMWGDANKCRIDKWSQTTDYHRAFVGGNTFLIYYRDYFVADEREIKKHYPQEKINVFVSLQIEKYYSDEITKAVNESGDEIVWHFKTHPFHEKSLFVEKIKPKLISLENVEYEFTNSVSLYDIMKYVDINVTYSSSTAFEMREMEQISTIFVRREEESSQAGFYYCKDAKEIAETIGKILHIKQLRTCS